MRLPEYAEYDGVGLAELVAKGEVAPSDLAEAAIERIETHDPKLNAVTYKAFDEARRTAAGDLPEGPFRGVPFLIKDLGVQVKGWPRTSASRFARIEADAQDSELVRRYRAAGLVFLGKTNTPEFGIPGVTNSHLLGPCRNPWNTEHIAGGSSGGAAAAVASGMTPMAHASDGLGSIRIPAAVCGLVGLKVTRDRNPNGPDDWDRAIGFSVDHVVTRTVRDSAAMLDATGWPEPDSPYAAPPRPASYLQALARPPARLRIAVSTATPNDRAIAPEIRAAVERTAQLLGELGHTVFEQDLTLDWRAFYRAQSIVSASNFSAQIQRWVALKGREPEPDEMSPLAWRGYEAGRRITGQQALWAWGELRVFNRRILAHWDGFDVLLQPMHGALTPRVDELDPTSQDLKAFDRVQSTALPFTPPYNMTGQPSMSLPLETFEAGLPMGMMFTGRYGEEETLLRLAAELEQARPWRDRRPAMWG